MLALTALCWHMSWKRFASIATLTLVAVPFTTIFSSFFRFWTGTCLIFKKLFRISIIINICRQCIQNAAFFSYYLIKNTVGILLLSFVGPSVHHTLKIIITRTNRVCSHFQKFPHIHIRLYTHVKNYFHVSLEFLNPTLNFLFIFGLF